MADVGGAIGSILLLGVDDEVTYSWFHQGPGTATMDANADGWRALRDVYEEALLLVARGLAESKAEWAGVAADAAHGAVSPVRAWAEQALDSATMAYATVKQQSAVFNDIEGLLSPPVPVPDKPWYNDFWPGDTNYDQALQAKQVNSMRNVELVRQYRDSTDANNAGYPMFDTPVEVTTGVSQQPEQPGQPVQPRDGGAVEWRGGPRQPGGSGEPGQPAPLGPPSTVDSPDQPTSSGQPVSPSQSVPGTPAPSPVMTPAPVAGQDPAPARGPVTSLPAD